MEIDDLQNEACIVLDSVILGFQYGVKSGSMAATDIEAALATIVEDLLTITKPEYQYLWKNALGELAKEAMKDHLN